MWLRRDNLDGRRSVLLEGPLCQLYRFFWRKWFGHVFVGLFANCAQHIFWRAIRSHNDNFGMRFASPNSGKDLEARQLRHPNIEESQSKIRFLDLAQCVGAIAHGGDSVSGS